MGPPESVSCTIFNYLNYLRTCNTETLTAGAALGVVDAHRHDGSLPKGSERIHFPPTTGAYLNDLRWQTERDDCTSAG